MVVVGDHDVGPKKTVAADFDATYGRNDKWARCAHAGLYGNFASFSIDA